MRPSKEFMMGLFRRIFGTSKQKVFVIGFHKTGTSSMGKALQIVGFRVCGSLKEGYDYSKQQIPFLDYLMVKAKRLLLEYDAFQDTPWFLLYKHLYEQYPSARFILTIRDEISWIQSIQNHFGKDHFPYHLYIYGDVDSFRNQRKFIEVYRNHNQEVIEFFKDKKEQLLVFDLSEEDNQWDVLCNFLDISKPIYKFPHANKSGDRKNFLSRIKKWLKKSYYSKCV
ncbi:MAG TPA: sulfotransferase [Flavobacteriaceae bacterium]|nr:sulfotransferase [Flavobacteriaceae bacterium]